MFKIINLIDIAFFISNIKLVNLAILLLNYIKVLNYDYFFN